MSIKPNKSTVSRIPPLPLSTNINTSRDNILPPFMSDDLLEDDLDRALQFIWLYEIKKQLISMPSLLKIDKNAPKTNPQPVKRFKGKAEKLTKNVTSDHSERQWDGTSQTKSQRRLNGGALTPRQQMPRQEFRPLDLKNFIAADIDILQNIRQNEHNQHQAPYRADQTYISQPITIPSNIKVSQVPYFPQTYARPQQIAQPLYSSQSMAQIPYLASSNSYVSSSQFRGNNLQQSHTPVHTLQVPKPAYMPPSYSPNLNIPSYIPQRRQKHSSSFTTGLPHNQTFHNVSSPDILANFSNSMSILPRYDQYCHDNSDNQEESRSFYDTPSRPLGSPSLKSSTANRKKTDDFPTFHKHDQRYEEIRRKPPIAVVSVQQQFRVREDRDKGVESFEDVRRPIFPQNQLKKPVSQKIQRRISNNSAHNGHMQNRSERNDHSERGRDQYPIQQFDYAVEEEQSDNSPEPFSRQFSTPQKTKPHQSKPMTDNITTKADSSVKPQLKKQTSKKSNSQLSPRMQRHASPSVQRPSSTVRQPPSQTTSNNSSSRATRQKTPKHAQKEKQFFDDNFKMRFKDFVVQNPVNKISIDLTNIVAKKKIEKVGQYVAHQQSQEDEFDRELDESLQQMEGKY